MYSIIIVDDEPLIAIGIERSCKWEDFGSKVNLVASDPEQAKVTLYNYFLSEE